MKKNTFVFFAAALLLLVSFQKSSAKINNQAASSGSIVYNASSVLSRLVPVGISGVVGESGRERIAYRLVSQSRNRLLVEVENQSQEAYTISLIEYDHLTRMLTRRTIRDGFQLGKKWYLEAGNDENGLLSSLGSQLLRDKEAFSSIYFAAMNEKDAASFEAFIRMMRSEAPIEGKVSHPGYRVALRIFGIGFF